MEKRRVTITIGGQPCSFYSDDPDGYLADLEKRVNAVMKQTAWHAVPAVILLADQLMRSEQKGSRKQAGKPQPKAEGEDRGQVSVWELLEA